MCCIDLIWSLKGTREVEPCKLLFPLLITALKNIPDAIPCPLVDKTLKYLSYQQRLRLVLNTSNPML